MTGVGKHMLVYVKLVAYDKKSAFCTVYIYGSLRIEKTPAAPKN
jgi:hypothetical protein